MEALTSIAVTLVIRILLELTPAIEVASAFLKLFVTLTFKNCSGDNERSVDVALYVATVLRVVVGACVGCPDGALVGWPEGSDVGVDEGHEVGTLDGTLLGKPDGFVGVTVG